MGGYIYFAASVNFPADDAIVAPLFVVIREDEPVTRSVCVQKELQSIKQLLAGESERSKGADTEHASRVAQLESAVASSQKEVGSLEADLARERQQLAALEEQRIADVSKLKSEVDQLQLATVSSLPTCACVRARTRACLFFQKGQEECLAASKGLQREMEEVLRDLEKEKAEAQRLTDELNQATQRSLSDKTHWQATLDKCQVDMDHLKTELAARTAEVEQSRVELCDLKKTNEDTLSDLGTSRQDIGRLTETNAQLESRCSDLKSELQERGRSLEESLAEKEKVRIVCARLRLHLPQVVVSVPALDWVVRGGRPDGAARSALVSKGSRTCFRDRSQVPPRDEIDTTGEQLI